MWNVESSMAGIFLIITRRGVTIATIAIEIARIGRFAITSHTKFVTLCVIHHRIGSIHLRTRTYRNARHQDAQCHLVLHLLHLCLSVTFIIKRKKCRLSDCEPSSKKTTVQRPYMRFFREVAEKTIPTALICLQSYTE